MTGFQATLLFGLCTGTSFGINQVARPQFEYSMTQNDRVQVTGWLKFDVDGTTAQIDLASAQLIRGAATRVVGSSVPVRALWLRSAELDDQSDPDLEVFADFSNMRPAPESSMRSLDILVGRELPVLGTPPGAMLHSRLRVPGAGAHAPIKQGSIVIREVTPLPNPAAGAPAFHAVGELNVVLQDAAAERQIRGRFEASLMWY